LIKSFGSKETEQLSLGHRSRRFVNIESVARRKLRMIQIAARLEDLKVPPANRLEALAGDRKGQHSIRINDQWRVCFEWRDGDAYNVEITDYHWARKRKREMHKKSQELLPPIHPGEILSEEFLTPLDLSMNRVAHDLRVPLTRVADIVHGRRAVSVDTALRLARYLGTTAEFWMNAQTAYDLEVADREALDGINRDVHPLGDADRVARPPKTKRRSTRARRVPKRPGRARRVQRAKRRTRRLQKTQA
jgi:addiction module HigA family antidote